MQKRKDDDYEEEEEEEEDDVMALLGQLRGVTKVEKVQTSEYEKLLNRKGDLNRLSSANDQDVSDDDDSILVKKDKFAENDDSQDGNDDDDDDDTLRYRSERARKKLRIDKNGIARNGESKQRIVFTDEGEAITPFEKLVQEMATQNEETDLAKVNDSYLKGLAQKLQSEDVTDKATHQQRLKERRWEKRRKMRAMEMGDTLDDDDSETNQAKFHVTLGDPNPNDSNSNTGSNDDSDASDDKGMDDTELALQMITARR